MKSWKIQPEQNLAVTPPEDHPMAPWIETISKLTLDELITQTRIEHPTWPEWVINTWCPAKKQLDENILSILRVQGTEWQEDIPKLSCSTLIVTADPEKVGIVTPDIADRVRAMDQRCQVTYIPGTGHHIRFEDYETYMKHVHAFLDEIKSGQSSGDF